MILHIRDGQITNPAALERHIKNMNGIYSLELKARNHRSKNQNDYFHSIVLEYVLEGLKDAGYSEIKTKEDAKSVCKSLFLKQSNVGIEWVKNTSELTKMEFTEFIGDILQWSSEFLHLVIPEPNYQVPINYENNKL